MARYNPTITVKDALVSYMNNPAFQEASGKLVINSSTSKRSGALFLYKGKVYSIQVKGYPGRLFTRLVGSGLLSDDGVAELQRKYGRDQSNPAIIDYAAQKMMITAEQAGEFIREFSLGAWDDLFSWIGVKVEWKNGVTTENTVFSSRPVALERLVDLGARRAKYLEEIASDYTINPEDLYGLKFQRLDATYNPSGLEGDLMAYATREYSIAELGQITGVPLFNLASTVYQLWEADRVEVWYGEFKLNRKEIEQMHSNPDTYGKAQPVIRTDTRDVDVEYEAELTAPAQTDTSAVSEDEEVLDDEALTEEELEELRADPEIKAALEKAETAKVQAEAVGVRDEDRIEPLPEEDLEYVNEIDSELEDEDLNIEEDDMTDEKATDEDLDFIPLDEDEEAAEQPSVVEAPTTLEEFMGTDTIEVDEPEDVLAEFTEEESAASSDADPLLGTIAAQVKARREELRAAATEAAERMAECNEAILADGTQLAALDAQISSLQQELDTTQARIQENEEARAQWESVYDEASASYATFQKQLAALTDLS